VCPLECVSFELESSAQSGLWRWLVGNTTIQSHAGTTRRFKMQLQVYMGCILQTKKRYTGLMFENEDDPVGVIESKGTEVIRRDTVPVTGKILKKSLDIFFRTRDLSKVKQYLHERWLKVRGLVLPEVKPCLRVSRSRCIVGRDGSSLILQIFRRWSREKISTQSTLHSPGSFEDVRDTKHQCRSPPLSFRTASFGKGRGRVPYRWSASAIRECLSDPSSQN
jgi:hypothetical protein